MFNPSDVSTGAMVPAVAPSDLAAIVKLMMDFAIRDEQEHRQCAVGLNVYQAACSPGADTGAVWFRAATLCLALKHGDFTEFMHEGELKDAFLRLWATFPFKAVDIQQDGSFQINRGDFDEALRKLNSE